VLCQSTHSRHGVSKSFAKPHTSVASFGILGVQLKTRRLYALSGRGPESFYTASVTGGQFGGESVQVLVGTIKSPIVWTL